jgi:flagellar basal body-associated protein FliL
MDQNNSIDDKKPKKKRVSDIVYYVIYVFVLVSIGAAVYFFYKFIG